MQKTCEKEFTVTLVAHVEPFYCVEILAAAFRTMGQVFQTIFKRNSSISTSDVAKKDIILQSLFQSKKFSYQ